MTWHHPWMHVGRHSARLVLPSAHPGAVISYQNDLAIPFSFGPGVGTNCGTGYQGFYVTAGQAYNVSIWARSDDAGMNLSIASGRWAGSAWARRCHLDAPHFVCSMEKHQWNILRGV